MTLLDLGQRDSATGELLVWIAGALIFAVMAIWIGLWAINKPVHPSACDNYRGAECAAAVAGQW